MKVYKKYKDGLPDILKVKATEIPANPLEIKSSTFNECRVKDTDISSRESCVSSEMFITLSHVDFAVIAVAVVVVMILSVELALQKNRKGKIRACNNQNNSKSHRMDDDQNRHENLSRANSLSEKNVSNSNIDDGNEKGKSIKKSKQVTNLDEASCYNAKINKQKPNSKYINNNKLKSQHNLIEKSQSDKIIMDFFKDGKSAGNFNELSNVIISLINKNIKSLTEKEESQDLNELVSGVISKISNLFSDYLVGVLNENCGGGYKKTSPEVGNDRYKISKDGQEDDYVFNIKTTNQLGNSDNVKLANLKFRLTSYGKYGENSKNNERFVQFDFPNNPEIHQKK